MLEKNSFSYLKFKNCGRFNKTKTNYNINY